MANIQFLRGTEAKNNTYVGPEGSITVDITNWRIRLHDGLTAGGFALARLDDIAVTSVAGKTGAVVLNKSDVGLSNVDNTSDLNKPVSTATQNALNLKLNSNDASVTNAREWTAATVSQAEAEAGTDTTRRAFTAQRVRQSIAAYTLPFSTTDRTKLDGIAAGAQANVPTNLSLGTRTATAVPVNSSTGTSVSLPVATTSLAGLMSSADKTKLDGIVAYTSTNFNNDFALKSTTNLAEGINLYFTNARAKSAVETLGLDFGTL